MVSAVALIVCAVLTAQIAASGRLKLTRHLITGIRARHVLPALGGLVVTAAGSWILLWAFPFTGWSWWHAAGQSGTPLGSGLVAGGTAFAALFLLLLIAALPTLALGEEMAFRSGSELRTPRRRTYRAVGFGLVHALVGVPLAVALMLTVLGLLATRAYLRGCGSSDAPPAFAVAAFPALVPAPGPVAVATPTGVSPDAASVVYEPSYAGLLEAARLHIAWNYLLASAAVILLAASVA